MKIQTQIILLQTEQDILVREELEELAKNNDQLKLWYTLDRPTEGMEKLSAISLYSIPDKHLLYFYCPYVVEPTYGSLCDHHHKTLDV